MGWDEIDAIEIDIPAIDRELWEIDENLIRAELTPAQVAQHLARRKELWEAREVSAQRAPKPSGGRPEGFANDTAKKTGQNKATINRAISRAVIPDDVMAMVQGTALDTGKYLDDLKRIPADEMKARVDADLKAAAAGNKAARKREKEADGKSLKEEAEEKIAGLLAEYVPGEWRARKSPTEAGPRSSSWRGLLCGGHAATPTRLSSAPRSTHVTRCIFTISLRATTLRETGLCCSVTISASLLILVSVW